MPFKHAMRDELRCRWLWPGKIHYIYMPQLFSSFTMTAYFLQCQLMIFFLVFLIKHYIEKVKKAGGGNALSIKIIILVFNFPFYIWFQFIFEHWLWVIANHLTLFGTLIFVNMKPKLRKILLSSENSCDHFVPWKVNCRAAKNWGVYELLSGLI